MQVIEEIEEMMQESPDPDDDESPSQSDLSMLSQDLNALKRSASNTSYEDRKWAVLSFFSLFFISVHKETTLCMWYNCYIMRIKSKQTLVVSSLWVI